MNRREFLPLAGVAAAAGYASLKLKSPPPKLAPGPAGNSAVAVIRANSYSAELAQRILEGVRQCGLNAAGKRVLLKPNLVEFDPTTVINTNAAVLAAAWEVFHQLGAAQVLIAEGPGHRRDSFGLADDAGYFDAIHGLNQSFIDLNRDDVACVRNFAGESKFYFPQTVLAADLIVSLAKMKTHHWAGVTLSMKNLFGIVPGSVYGWPKNKLHYIGIEESILALNRRFRNTFAIVDGIVGMEGNGPIQGTPKPTGVLVMGSDPVAVDATCCRIMGVDPARVEYLRRASEFGHVEPARIEQRGETIASTHTEYSLLPQFHQLRLGS